MCKASSTQDRTQSFSRLRGCATLLLAITATDASAHPPPGALTIFYFGMIPTVLLLVAYVISLFGSRAPWADKLWIGLGLAASLVLTLVLAGNNSLHLPHYAVPLVWIVPALVWLALSRWFKRHRPD